MRLLSHSGSPEWIFEGDIKSCFDRISHDWLLANVPMDRSILRKWLKAGFMDGSTLYPTDEGTPQGGIASPVLANLALDGLQEMLRQHFPKHHRKQVNLLRYADDFIITGATREILVEEVQPLVEQFLSERGLALSPTKTVITHVDDGFDFLGQTVRRGNEKLLIKPAKKSIHAVLTKIREIIRGSHGVSAAVLVARVNPVVRGWANYHRHVACTRAFSSVDNEIWKSLWRWARRRHPNKSARWVKHKYFPARGTQRWRFSGVFVDANGAKREAQICLANSIHFQRHIPIRAGANPFDPKWDAYFQKRRRRPSVARAAFSLEGV